MTLLLCCCVANAELRRPAVPRSVICGRIMLKTRKRGVLAY